MIVTNGSLAPIFPIDGAARPPKPVAKKAGRMTRTQFFLPLCLGCLLLLDAAGLEAQSWNPRRPYRALPGGQINHWESPTWRMPIVTDSAPIVAPPDEVEPVADVLPVSGEEPWAYPAESFFPELCDTQCPNVWNVPNMLGDFFGAGTETLIVRGNQLLNANPGDTFDPATLGTGAVNRFLVLSPGSSVVGRQKAADNNSPMPRDRVFLNYNYITNASLQAGGVDVHRLTPGWERTFLDEMLSLEIRVPMAMTLDSDFSITGGSSRDQAELGNVNLAVKTVLHSTNECLISAGLAATVPTANSLRYFNANGRELVRVDNDAVHLLPYLAAAWTDGGFFTQGFLQADFDLNGNPVLIDNGTKLRGAGEFRDASNLYLDLGAGYWLIKDRQGGLITGIAPTLELHYNTSLNPTDNSVISPSGIRFDGDQSQVEIMNFVVGATFQLAGRNSIAVGYAKPIATGVDEQFASEVRVLFNYDFGGK
jgi:hypothetical protein